MIIYKETPPEVDDYLNLRKQCLSEKTPDAAKKGLPNSLYGVIAILDGHVIGMGRVVGDGGLNFEVVDIAVLPDQQGKGIGKTIMQYIMAYLDTHAPESAYISLMADVPELYKKFGFELTRPQTEGMSLVKSKGR